MNILQLYQDFGVNYRTEGHKHCRPGFVNTVCPFCTGHEGYHLSYHLEDDYFVCWRCGWHPIGNTLSELLRLPIKQIWPIIKQYGILTYTKPTVKVQIRKKAFKLPSNVIPLTFKHKKYLESREFDPEKLEKLWGLQSTGPLSTLDSIDYKHRIVIPFYWNGEMVSFDTRSQATGTQEQRYKACPIERELIEHKDILYGNQEYWQSTGIVVEGPTDVWRLGPVACATSGIKFKPKQIRALANAFKRIAIVFDDEPQAKVQANLLKSALRNRGVDAFRVSIEGDPGGLSQDDADYLVKDLLKSKPL